MDASTTASFQGTGSLCHPMQCRLGQDRLRGSGEFVLVIHAVSVLGLLSCSSSPPMVVTIFIFGVREKFHGGIWTKGYLSRLFESKFVAVKIACEARQIY